MFLLPSAAFAYQTTFCARMNNGFTDKDAGDLWTEATDPYVPLRGVRMWITKYDATGTWQGYVREEQPSDENGCVLFTSTAGWSYGWYIETSARVNGVDVDVCTDDVGSCDRYWHYKDFGGSTGRYFPSSDQTKWIQPSFASEWASLAVGAQAMYLSNAGVDDCTCGECGRLLYSNTTTNGGGGNGSYQEHIIVASTRKFMIAHETGHGVVRRRDECLEPVDEWDAPGDYWCDATPDYDHGNQDGPLAPEWQSASLKEGFADFYAAWMWNNRTSDCALALPNGRSYNLDVDDDWEFDHTLSSDPYFEVSCEGKPVSTGLDAYISADDWLEDLADHANQPPSEENCTVSVVGISTSYDVTRYLWDMYTDQSVSLDDLVDLYDASDPHDWAGRKDLVYLDRNPFIRWAMAADLHTPDLLDEHDAEKHNGLDHGPGR